MINDRLMPTKLSLSWKRSKNSSCFSLFKFNRIIGTLQVSPVIFAVYCESLSLPTSSEISDWNVQAHSQHYKMFFLAGVFIFPLLSKTVLNAMTETASISPYSFSQYWWFWPRYGLNIYPQFFGSSEEISLLYYTSAFCIDLASGRRRSSVPQDHSPSGNGKHIHNTSNFWLPWCTVISF